MAKSKIIVFTTAEIKALLIACGEFTDANARDIDEMMKCGLTKKEAQALFSAERKLCA